MLISNTHMHVRAALLPMYSHVVLPMQVKGLKYNAFRFIPTTSTCKTCAVLPVNCLVALPMQVT
jgi:hypothetical protein